MTLVGGIDPGNAAPGYAVWSTEHQAIVYASVDPWSPMVAHTAVEGQWAAARGSKRIGVMSMAALAFDAGLRLGLVPTTYRYRLPPKVWRGVFGWDGLPKAVIVSRLRRDLVGGGDGWTDDVVEACGIAKALAMLLDGPASGLRKYEVRR